MSVTVNLLPADYSKIYLSVVNNKLTFIQGKASSTNKAIKKIAENLFKTDPRTWEKSKKRETKKIEKLLPKEKLCISQNHKKEVGLYFIKAQKTDMKSFVEKVSATVDFLKRTEGLTKIVSMSVKKDKFLKNKLKDKHTKYDGYELEKNTRKILKTMLNKKIYF